MKKTGLFFIGLATVAMTACNNGPSGNSGSKGNDSTPFVPTSVYTDDPSAKDYERESDDDVYERQLGAYEDLLDAAKVIEDDDERLVAYAKAECYLLDNAIIMPNTTEGGNFGISRVAPRTVPYCFHGIDDGKFKNIVQIDAPNQFIKSTEREELKALWQAAADQNDSSKYNPKAYLEGKGYTIKTSEYRTTYSTAIRTFSVPDTYRASDTDYLTNFFEGLVGYDNVGSIQPAGCSSYEISEDGKTYTFHLRENWWVKNDGSKYAKVKAQDYVAGLKKAIDTGYVSYLAEGVVVNVNEYEEGSCEWSDVGCKALDDNTLEIKLVKPESFFITRLCYNTFYPICESFAESAGAYAEKEEDQNFALATDSSTAVYNGAFYPTTVDCTNQSKIEAAKNEHYWDAANTTVNKLVWVYDDGSNPTQTYNDAKSGLYAGITLSSSTGLLDLAKNDGFFDSCRYITDTTSTTYFGGFILNRGTYSYGTIASAQTETDKNITHAAVNNVWFRRAILHGIDRVAWNQATRDAEVAAYNLRNTYIPPEFSKLAKDVTVDGHKFEANTIYGDVLQYFLDEANAHIKTADGQDGWYDPEYAQECMNKALVELGTYGTGNIHMDNVYYGPSQAQTTDHNALKQLIENAFSNVKFDLQAATTTLEYYYTGYYCDGGEDVCQDFYYGSGWGPDFKDGSTYLDTFRRYGDMVMCIGLNNW